MIKTSAMFSAHAIHVLHVILRDTLIFLFILLVALFFWLKSGIYVDNLTFGHYKIDGLYIKLDKKLTLKVHEIVIPQSKAKPSFEGLDETFDNIKYLFTYFNYIELEKVHFQNNTLNIIFVDDILYVTSDDYEVAGNIQRYKKKYIAEISMLYLKKEKINIKGELVYDSSSSNVETKGVFEAYHIKGRFKASKENNTIDFAVNSEEFSDLRTVINKTSLNDSVKSWTLDRVQAEKYRVYSLSGKGELTDDGFKLDFDAFKGDILFEDVKIYYKEELPPVLAENFILSYRKKGLYFDLKNPMYKDRNLSGSTISVTDVVGENPMSLNLDLHIQTAIDDVVQEILKAYKLNIPVRQENGVANLDIKMEIGLGNSTKETTTFVNVDLGEGDVYINKVKLPVLKGNVQFEKGFVLLNDIDLKETWYEGRANGKIDLQTQKADLNFDAKQVIIGDKVEKFFMIKDKQLPLTLDYSKNTVVELPTLKIKVVNRPKDVLIQLGELDKIKPYLKDIGLQIDGGNIDIVTEDFKTYTFKGELKRAACFFYDKENICHTRIPCSGKVTEKNMDFYAFDKRFHYNKAKSRIKVKDLNIDLMQFISSNEKKQKSKKDKKENKKYVIIGKNSKLRYDKFTLVTDSYDIEVKSNGNLAFIGSLDGDIIKFNEKGKHTSLQAFRVKDKMLHPLIDFDGLKKGRYTVTIAGDLDKQMKGKIIVEGGIMSDFAAYNNTLAFINTLPALATLQNPGFSQKGFEIEEGVVNYRRLGNKVYFDSVYIKGGSATIVGRGEVNIKTKAIKMKLAILTARTLGKVVGNIPLLGYILMGKDKSMTVGLKITGTLDNPKIQTSATKDILTLPLDLIKRTFKSPAHFIEKEEPIPQKKTPLDNLDF